MPNWNSNYMNVKGNGVNVLNFIKENYNTTRVCENEYIYILDFEKFLPTPLDDKGEIIDGWYEWRYENWGCKWSPCSEQFNHLTVTYNDGSTQCYCMLTKGTEDLEFDEKNIDKLLENTSNIKEILLESSFETPWCPPHSIIVKWSERYKDIELELVNKYYEPGCAFAGKMGFNNEEGFYDECYDCSDMETYIEFLLQEGLEDIDWYLELILGYIEDMYLEEKGKEFVDKLYNKITEQLENEKSNSNKAKLICEIFDKHNEYTTGENKVDVVQAEPAE